MTPPPEHVAAYAAGLHHACPGESWFEVAAMVAAMGLGYYSPDDLGPAAEAWALAHVSPEARDHVARAAQMLGGGQLRAALVPPLARRRR